jgi:hypothetical protein
MPDLIGSGPEGAFSAFADQEVIDRWLAEGFLHQHGNETPIHHQLCPCKEN